MASQRIFAFLFAHEQKRLGKSALHSKLHVVARIQPFCELNRRIATQTKMQLAKSLTLESEQTIDFLKKNSELLKNQRRHFDDAVVTHCIRLINDYAEESTRGPAPVQ
jgi:hypothetical protein